MGKRFRFLRIIMTNEVTVTGYRPEYAAQFRALNVAWLEKYFYVEPIDEEMLGDPQRYIIDNGGRIFFALQDGAVAGTCALLYEKNGDLELGKMAVEERFQGKGIGHVLMQAAISNAKEMGAEKLFLYSNRKLHPALHLYRKYGFVEIPLDSNEYKRSDIKMVKDLRDA
jgi:GNAT superfamily N-acetyltransferase